MYKDMESVLLYYKRVMYIIMVLKVFWCVGLCVG